eukprot:scaffold17889_cov21-Tisochrysis_lutea.AAC.1
MQPYPPRENVEGGVLSRAIQPHIRRENAGLQQEAMVCKVASLRGDACSSSGLLCKPCDRDSGRCRVPGGTDSSQPYLHHVLQVLARAHGQSVIREGLQDKANWYCKCLRVLHTFVFAQDKTLWAGSVVLMQGPRSHGCRGCRDAAQSGAV